MRLALALLAAAVSAGCVPYPIYQTLQPEAVVTVLGESGEPLADAAVTLISSAYPYGRVMSRSTRLTDAAGRATFEARREWRTEVLMIHGWKEYFWNLCIERPGFVTQETELASAEAFRPVSQVGLVRGESRACRARPSLER